MNNDPTKYRKRWFEILNDILKFQKNESQPDDNELRIIIHNYVFYSKLAIYEISQTEPNASCEMANTGLDCSDIILVNFIHSVAHRIGGLQKTVEIVVNANKFNHVDYYKNGGD